MKLLSVYRYYFLLLVFTAAACAGPKKATLNNSNSSYTQSAPSSRSSGENSRSSSTAGAEQQRTMKKKGKKAARAKTHDDLVKDFENRMEASAKQKKKDAKMAEKPQYSDPSYFGHKKKPKKRPVGKRKFCKECGIVH